MFQAIYAKIALVFLPILGAVLLSPYAFAVGTKAENNVSLVVWMEDKPSPLPPRHTISKQRLEMALRVWSEMGIGPIRALFIEHGKAESLGQHLAETIQPSDLISNIILADHGTTNRRENRSVLTELGEFGEDGVTGHLRSLFEQIGPQLSSEVHISLDSCSTACGSKRSVEARVRGLHKELSKYGVKRLSVWGARQLLLHIDNYQPYSPRHYRATSDPFLRSLAKSTTTVGILTGTLATALYSGLSFSGINQEVLELALTWGGGTTVGAFVFLHQVFSQIIDVKGYLVVSEDGQTQTLEVEAGTMDALYSTRKSCEQLLK